MISASSTPEAIPGAAARAAREPQAESRLRPDGQIAGYVDIDNSPSILVARVLKPGGILRIVAPDLVFHAERHLRATRAVMAGPVGSSISQVTSSQREKSFPSSRGST